MKSKLFNLLSILLPLVLGLGLVVYFYNSFTNEQLALMKSHFINANYFYVAISLVIAIIGYVLRAYRWKYTLTQIGEQPNFMLNFMAVSVGYFVNLSIPRSGEVARAVVLKNYQNVPLDKGFGTIIAERIVDFFILLLFILAAVIIEFNTLKDFLLLYIPVEKLIIVLIIGFGFLLIGLYLYNYSKLSIVLKIKEKVAGLKEGVLSVMHLPNKWYFLGHTILIWISYVLMFYCSMFALPETATVSFSTALVAFVIGSLTVAFTNGGFGFFPVLIANILFLYNVPLEAGNAFGWIAWTSQLLITVILGLLSFLGLSFYKKHK